MDVSRRHVPMLVGLLLGLTQPITAQGLRPAESDSKRPEKTQVVTPTRTAVLFGGLEREVAEAVRRRDTTALDRLLLQDFELVSASHPGEPVSREDWQPAVLSHVPKAFRIADVSVRLLGATAALVSFSYEQDANPPGLSGRFTFVDLWVNERKSWRLQGRYAAPGLESPVPGWVSPEPPIEKK